MLNQMGDGGPFVFKEWDEAVASMAMCEEATFVFSVGATQRAKMPFVACRQAPPGTVLVVEVGLINVKREGGRKQEVNDFLTAKFVAEKRQEKLDRLDEQKFMRLREKHDRREKIDSVMKLISAKLGDQNDDAMAAQKDTADAGLDGVGTKVAGPDAAAGALPATCQGGAATGSAAGVSCSNDDADEWEEEEEPQVDYEGLGEGDDFFFPDGEECAPLNLPSCFDDDEEDVSSSSRPLPSAEPPAAAANGEGVPHFEAGADLERRARTQPAFVASNAFDGARAGYVFQKGSEGLGYYLDKAAAQAPWGEDAGSGALGAAPWDVSDPSALASSKPALSAPPKRANDPWAAVDSVDTSETRKRDQEAADRFAAAATKDAANSAMKALAAKRAAAAKKASSAA